MSFIADVPELTLQGTAEASEILLFDMATP